MGKRFRARRANERGRRLDRLGRTAEAVEAYEQACKLDPSWSVPFYNKGLVQKYAGEWEQSLRSNQRATELDPDDQAGWWNLGIAATALGRWDVARAAWRGAGVDVPDGEGPLDYPCGQTPIRLNPFGDGEVVWSRRIDPARALLRSVPLPESGFRFDDLVLNDGAPNGYRELDGEEVPVFDCLALLEASPYGTWLAEIELGDARHAEPAIERLMELALDRSLAAEDWTTSIQLLCKDCSEGRPHHEHKTAATAPEHRVGIAARTSEEARRLVSDWQAKFPDVRVVALELVLPAAS
jgi:tetratricopeptide (TPR) repeat protein